ncbi:hypothetical protein GCM10009609_54550 [Pseudonocardia aurantiaca]|uniref:DUF222 domain-containing protein n=1 Tax=Pseudonocardia aurantiaca TaxID=75290 RepID=A0ABW4FFR1_9PSEU
MTTSSTVHDTTTTPGPTALVGYLRQARAAEHVLAGLLATAAAGAPEQHRDMVTEQATQARQRTHDLDARLAALAHPGPLSTTVAAVRELAGDTVGISAAALGATLGLLRRDPVEPTLLDRTSELAAAAAYAHNCHRALAEAARTLNDTTTAELASTCHDETRTLLDQLDDAVPALVTAALATTGGRSSYRAAVATATAQVRGAAGNLSTDAGHAQHELRDAVTDLLRRARRVPGVTRAETTLGELTAAPEDLPIADYPTLTITQIIERLPALTQAQLGTLHGFETAHANRSRVLNKIQALREDEPWPGYDTMTVKEIRDRLSDADPAIARAARNYERRHHNRAHLLGAADPTS